MKIQFNLKFVFFITFFLFMNLNADIGTGISSIGKLSSIKENLAINSDTINIGTNLPASSFSNYFTVKNDGGITSLLNGSITESAEWINSIYPTSFSLKYNEIDTIYFSGEFPIEPDSFFTSIYITSTNKNDTVSVYGKLTPSKLTVAPISIDLGTNEPGYNFSNFLIVKNEGGALLKGIVQESADWIKSLDPTSFSLKYNETKIIFFSGNFPENPEEFSTLIYINSNGGEDTVNVFGKLKVAEMTVEPLKINLGTHLPGYSFSSYFVVKNTGEMPLEGKIIENSDWILALSPTEFNILNNDIDTIYFAGTFPSNVDSIFSSIYISSNAGEDTLEIFGQITPAILSVLPRSIDLGTNTSGSNFSDYFVIKNEGGRQLNVNIIEISDWITSISPSNINLQYNDQDTINISGIFPVSPDSFSTLIYIYANTGNDTISIFGSLITTDITQNNLVPNSFFLNQNYPNPFNMTTEIIFGLKKECFVQLNIFNSIGEKINNIVNKRMRPGIHKVHFNANGLASGIYYYRISTDEFSSVKKMLFIQ